jgi:hypothetical protein
MSDEQIIKSAIAAVDLYIESLKTSMSPAAEMGGIEELRDLFAISGLTSEDYVLYSVSELIRRVIGWPEQRRENFDRAGLQQAAVTITRALENMLAT